MFIDFQNFGFISAENALICAWDISQFTLSITELNGTCLSVILGGHPVEN
jgi:hypothetical protein